ncbi:MAG: peptide-methionine (S)-S-oxide reductase MsrA [Bacilli bacterium]|nr:peptide-methionine (S)-S-oxide reductase MsrA [Bacilli bacterium]
MNLKRIVFGGGCFWGVEAYFKRLKGVTKTTVGYANGNKENPTYEELKLHIATHVEACEIYYDSQVISLEVLLRHLFRIINPYTLNRQGHDIGIQYRSGIYYKDNDDLKIIQTFIENEQKNDLRRIVVEVKLEQEYYLAEDYHQDYLTKNPNGYCHVDLRLLRNEETKENQ